MFFYDFLCFFNVCLPRWPRKPDFTSPRVRAPRQIQPTCVASWGKKFEFLLQRACKITSSRAAATPWISRSFWELIYTPYERTQDLGLIFIHFVMCFIDFLMIFIDFYCSFNIFHWFLNEFYLFLLIFKWFSLFF